MLIVCIALTVAVWVAFVLRLGTDREEMLSLAGQMGLSLSFSLLLGLWIAQVVDQSHERAVLITELESAQAELGRSHHAAGVTAERERRPARSTTPWRKGSALVAAFASVGLHDSTLGEALERLAGRFEQETGVQVEVIQTDGAAVQRPPARAGSARTAGSGHHGARERRR